MIRPSSSAGILLFTFSSPLVRAEVRTGDTCRIGFGVGDELQETEVPSTGGRWEAVDLGVIRINEPGDLFFRLRPVEEGWSELSIRRVVLVPSGSGS